jgi:hypothetical protein
LFNDIIERWREVGYKGMASGGGIYGDKKCKDGEAFDEIIEK